MRYLSWLGVGACAMASALVIICGDKRKLFGGGRVISNYMETMVNKVLMEELRDHAANYTELCLCPSCIACAKATALNLLPPFYVTSAAGEVFGEYRHKELQHLSDVVVAMAKGLEALRSLPPHNAAAGA